MNKTRLFLLGVAAVILLVACGVGARYVLIFLDDAYRSPVEADLADRTPAMEGEADAQVAAEEKARTKPLEELGVPLQDVEYRAFPVIGSRVAVWSVAQLHLLFAAFVLAVPIFALIIEFIGYITKDKRYDALAHEFTRLLSVSFSLIPYIESVAFDSAERSRMFGA